MIDQTQIHLKHFERAQQHTIPQGWKFWEPREDTQIQNYDGATHDTLNINMNPNQDIIQWDREAAMLGYLPDTFKIFLSTIGIPTHKQKTTITNITKILRDHTFTIFQKYRRAIKEKTQINEKDSDPLTLQPTNQDTQEQEKEEDAEDMEWIQPSEDEESMDSAQDEEEEDTPALTTPNNMRYTTGGQRATEVRGGNPPPLTKSRPCGGAQTAQAATGGLV